MVEPGFENERTQMKSTPPPKTGQLQRTTFSTSRLLDFCSEKELTAQTGHGTDEWPLVILKELLDNALDGCEEAGIAPEVTVAVDCHGITIADNGGGIPAEIIQGILDFTIRVSSREAYVSPTRGAQGNALKTILAMPFVLDGNTGRVDISAHGQRHEITFAVDRIAQRPVVNCQSVADEKVQNGTSVTVHWPDSASSILDEAEPSFVLFADAYTWLNPHLALAVDWRARRTKISTTAPDWEKWLPNKPTSAHWYRVEEFERLAAAYLTEDRNRQTDRYVRDLVSEFSGLSRSAKRKAVLNETGLARTHLSALANGQGLEHDVLAGLLKAMRRHSKTVQPAQLGIIGEVHLRTRAEQAGCDMTTFRYKKIAVVGSDALPMVVEAAFAMIQDADAEQARRLITGINWSPGIRNPFRTLDNASGWGDGLDALLQDRRAGSDEPIVFLLHVAHPRVRYTDRGKSAVAMASMDGNSIIAAVEAVTKEWTRQRKHEERDTRAAIHRRQAFARATKITVRDAAWQVMADAYMAASATGTLPAKGRQIYYAARRRILELTDKTELNAQYFEQSLLPDYQRERPDETADWDVVYDARGDFYAPHTGESVPLGTLEVRNYLVDVTGRAVAGVRDWMPIDLGRDQTCGPAESFAALLYIEKQGFDELFRAVKLAERFDIGILSAKGQSVTACRHLADEICGRYGIPLLASHDLDLAGQNIVHTLRNDTRRYEFKNQFDVIDIGLRLADAKEWGLESERVCYGRTKSGKVRDPRSRLKIVGATEEEAEFLCSELTGAGWCGQRIELNAFTSDKLVEWIESKLTAAGVKKIVPDKETLETAYRRALQGAFIRKRLNAIVKETGDQARKAKVPRHLDRLVCERFKADPAQSWVDAVATAANKAAAKSTKRASDQGRIQQAESPPKPSKCTKSKRQGGRPTKRPPAKAPPQPPARPPTLEDILSEKQIRQAKRVAQVAYDGAEDEYLAWVKARDEEATTEGFIAFCKRKRRKRRGGGAA
jgi:DNA topoisomerase VI subunit B